MKNQTGFYLASLCERFGAALLLSLHRRRVFEVIEVPAPNRQVIKLIQNRLGRLKVVI
jgi:hypothetical protein